MDADTRRSKSLEPIWRGIGLIMLLVMSVGGWFAAGWFLEWNNTSRAVPQLLGVSRGMMTLQEGVTIPNAWVIQGAVTFAFALLLYSIVFMVWAAASPKKRSELDADPIHRRIDKSKVR